MVDAMSERQASDVDVQLFILSYLHFTCSEAWRRRRAGVGLRGALRNHQSAQATADIISEKGHIPETELRDQNYDDEEM